MSIWVWLVMYPSPVGTSVLAKTFAKSRQESRRLHSLAQEFWVNVKGAHSPRLLIYLKDELSFEHLTHL
jgi:hypothetical protein